MNKTIHSSWLTVLIAFACICWSHQGHADSGDCRKDIPITTPDEDFIQHNNGTVTHIPTRLMWMRCALGQQWNGETCTEEAGYYNWFEALHTVTDIHFADYTDWRVPSYKELISILELSCYSPSINSIIFPNTPASNVSQGIPPSAPATFWTSTPFYIIEATSNPMRVLSVNFSQSHSDLSKAEEQNRVRLVRYAQ